MKSHIIWHKILPDKLPPIGQQVLLYRPLLWELIEYTIIFRDTTYKGYVDNGWTHWAYINLPNSSKK